MFLKTITPSEAKQWLDNKSAILIDVRDPDEHEKIAIQEAQLMPLSQLHTYTFSHPEIKKVIVHCQSGGRSSRACQWLQQQYPEIEFYNLEGGIKGWHASNLPVLTP